jgi:hypothetical protein
MDDLDRLLRELRWLQASVDLRRRTGRLGSACPPPTVPSFCEVVIEWAEATSESSAESVGC